MFSPHAWRFSSISPNQALHLRSGACIWFCIIADDKTTQPSNRCIIQSTNQLSTNQLSSPTHPTNQPRSHVSAIAHPHTTVPPTSIHSRLARSSPHRNSAASSSLLALSASVAAPAVGPAARARGSCAHGNISDNGDLFEFHLRARGCIWCAIVRVQLERMTACSHPAHKPRARNGWPDYAAKPVTVCDGQHWRMLCNQ